MPQNLILNIPQSPTINIVTPVTNIGCQANVVGFEMRTSHFLSLKEDLDQLQANSLSVNHQINRLRVKHEFQKGTAFQKAPLPSTFLPLAILSVPPISISKCWTGRISIIVEFEFMNYMPGAWKGAWKNLASPDLWVFPSSTPRTFMGFI